MPNSHENLTSLFTDIADAIRSKTGSSDPIVADNFPEAIEEIPQDEVVYNDVNFLDDYLGKIIYSYTKEEFLSLTEMPPNPQHEGLISHGWNWSFENAQGIVQTYGKLDIGQMYATDDDSTRIYIHLEDNETSPVLDYYCYSTAMGSVTIDKGDGSPEIHQEIQYGIQKILLEYSHGGDYRISITTTSSVIDLMAGQIFEGSYAASIRRIEFGTRVSFTHNHSSEGVRYPCLNLRSVIIPLGPSYGIPEGYFKDCISLKYLTLPRSGSQFNIGLSSFEGCTSLTAISFPGKSWFSSEPTLESRVFFDCKSLRRIVLSHILFSNSSTDISIFSGCFSLEGLYTVLSPTKLFSNLFYNCYSLREFTVPSSVTSCEYTVFKNCYSLKSLKFERSTPPSAYDDTFYNLPTGCTIYVPEGSLEAYTAEENYPDPNIYTYVEY